MREPGRVTAELAYMRLDADSHAVPWQVVQRAHVATMYALGWEAAGRTGDFHSPSHRDESDGRS